MRTRIFVAIVLAIAVGLATAASPYASASPDGLNRVAGDNGFADRGKAQDDSPLPGYAFPGVDDPKLATGLAGFTGTLFVFALGYGVARTVRRPA
jgi:hypothetical protein